MRKRCQHARSLQYKLRLAEEELLHDNAVELNPPVSATLLSPPLLPLQDPQDQHGKPQDFPPRRAVRRLALETVEMQQASDSLQRSSPSPKRIARRLLLSVQDGGVRAADRATAWEREGRQLAPKRGPGDSVLVREAAYVSD
jgi:hypothetical protein